MSALRGRRQQETRHPFARDARRHAKTPGLLLGSAFTLLLFANTTSAQTPVGLPFTESFSFDNLKNAAETTADWNTPSSRVQLPSENPLLNIFSIATAAENLPEAYVTRAVALGDLDGDGDLDLVDGTPGNSGVYLNDGTGNFGPGRVYTSPVTANTRAVAIGDIDADGDLDWVAGNLGSAPSRLYLNDGTGTSFTVLDFGPNTYRTLGIALADVNGDGRLDVVLANEAFQANQIYYNTGDPLLPFGLNGISHGTVSNVGEDSRAVLAGDLDADGDIDLVVLNNNEVNRVYLNQGLGFGGGAALSAGIPIGSDAYDSEGGALGDLNGDGLLDLVVANWALGQTSKVYLNNGAGADNDPFAGVTPIELHTVDSPRHARRILLGDADHDGDLDVFVISQAHSSGAGVLLNDGTGTTFVRVDIGSETEVTMDAAIGDVDGDRDLDLITGNNIVENGVSSAELKRLYRNAGTLAAGPAARQLTATATSLEVDDTAANIASVRLTAAANSVGPAFANVIDYWVSNDGGSSWVRAIPGRPVGFPYLGNALAWRANIDSRSPLTAASLALDSLSLELNSAPTVSVPLGSQAATEGQPLSLFASFSDTDTNPLFYSLTGLPLGTGIRINPTTGEIFGTPTNADATASYESSGMTLTAIATDGGLTAQDTFLLTVANVNGAPSFTSTPVTAAANGVEYQYSVTTQDADPGDVRTITAPNGLPAWLSLVDNGDGTAILHGTPSGADAGNHSIALRVTDAGLLTADQTFTIAVANSPPSFTSTPVTAATQGFGYSYAIATADPNAGDTRAITADTLPAWLTLQDNGDGTALLSGTPGNANVGTNAVALRVTDGPGAAVTQSFMVTVGNVNDPPSFSTLPVTNATQGVLYTYDVAAGDPDAGDVLQITATTLPAWLSLVDHGDGTATVSGTPGNGDVGSHSMVLMVRDAANATASQSATITVGGTNDAPSFTSAPVTTATEGQPYGYEIAASDPDAGDALAITAPMLPTWLTLTDHGNGTATLAGTPADANVGSQSVELRVTDSAGATATQSFAIAVADVNSAPTFDSFPMTNVTERQAYRYFIKTQDPDGESPTITAVTAPAWLKLMATGNGEAELVAQDSLGASSVQQFVVDVAPAADGPVITVNGNPQMTIRQGEKYSDPGATATDPQDGDLTSAIIVQNPVNTSVVSSYAVMYTVKDTAGNTSQAQRTVVVQAQPSSGGGGSVGIMDLLGLAFLGALAGGARRRRA